MKTDRTSLRKACDKNGIFWAREQLRAPLDAADRIAVQQWIADFETREKVIRDQVRNRLLSDAKSDGMVPVERAPSRGRLSKINAMDGIGNLLDAFGTMFRR